MWVFKTNFFLLNTLLVLATVLLFGAYHQAEQELRALRASSGTPLGLSNPAPAWRTKITKNLVIYALSDTFTGRKNFDYFVRHALAPLSADTDLFFVIKGSASVQLPSTFPSANRTASVVADCSNYGAWKAGLDAAGADYESFFFLSSDVIGPILPVWQRNRDWVTLLRKLLRGSVKLVGPTFNCDAVPKSASRRKALQGLFWVTDKEGLEVMYSSLSCEGQSNGVPVDVAVTEDMLARGHTVRSLMLSANHQGYYEECTHGDVWSPGSYHSISLNPLEVMFFKADSPQWPLVLERYVSWLDKSLQWRDAAYLRSIGKEWAIGLDNM